MLETSQMPNLEHMILHYNWITIRINYKLKILTLHNKNNLCLHNLEIQITEIYLLIKNIVPIVIEQIILSLPVSKNGVMMKKKDKLTLDENLRKILLYSTFVHPPTIEQKDMIHATEAEVL